MAGRKYSNQTGIVTRARNLADRAGTVLGASWMAGGLDSIKGQDEARKLYHKRIDQSKKRQAKRIKKDKGPSVSLPIPPRSR